MHFYGRLESLRRMPRRPWLVAAFLLILTALAWSTLTNPPLTAAPAGSVHYPDLQTVLPPGLFSIVRPTPATRELRYTHENFNLGDGPLEVRLEYDPATDTARPFQRLYTHDEAGDWSLVSELPLVATFQYHAVHGHYHFPLARFGIYSVAGDGSLGSPLLESPKVGYCLGDSVASNPPIPHQGPSEHSGANCDDPRLSEGISVGWADLYDSADAGQSIDITSLPDGVYWFRAVSDPFNYFAETNEANNITDLKLQITDTTVTIIGGAVHPNSMPPSVTLTSPPSGTVTSAVTISAAAEDASGITTLQFLLDGFPVGPPQTAAPYSFVWDSTATPNGTHYLSAQATAGTTFISTSPAVVINVANIAPPGPPPPGAPTVDRVVSVDAAGPATTPLFSTAGPDELLLAFVSGGGPAGAQTATVSGADLTWTLIARANSQAGTAEIWQARAPTQLTNVTVSSVLATAGFHQSLTVASFVNGAVGASGAAHAAAEAPVVGLTTTQPLSLLFGVGVSADRAITRSAAAGQLLVHQWLDSPATDTFWVQSLANAVTLAGTPVALVDNSPNTDSWNFAAVEITPTVILSDILVSNRTATSATVRWTTNVPATSQVQYGATPSYGATVSNSALVTNHQVALSGLEVATIYHYRLTSQSATGQSSSTRDFIFTTAAVSQITCAITSPGSGEALSGVVTVVADAHSSANVAGLQFYLDNLPLGPEITQGATFSLPWDTATATNGRHILSAIARDPTGNTATAVEVAVIVSEGATAPAVTTQHNDIGRTGANLAETMLTASNVTVSRFGKVFERSVDDEIYGQPLYLPNVNITAVGPRNIVLVATANDSVYAFDADDPAARDPLWHMSYVNPSAGIVPGHRSDLSCDVFAGNIGIIGTPVADAQQQTVYFVTRTKESDVVVQRLHAVDIRDGSERAGSPVVIQAPGFNDATQNQRAALLLASGTLYIAWGSYCETPPSHGWILGYDAANLQQTVAFNTTPDGTMGGIWQTGQGLGADLDGNIYGVTGNGSFDGDVGGRDFGNSFVKLAGNGALIDWFTPFNWEALNIDGLDLGAQGPMLIPDTSLVVGGGKQGVMYVLDRGNLGHFQSIADTQIVQSFAVSAGRLDAPPVFWNSPGGPTLFVWPSSDVLKAFRLVGGVFETTPVAQGPVAAGGAPGGALSISANGSGAGTGILWAVLPGDGSAVTQTQPGVVRAYDASDITRELWNSEQNATRDRLGNFSKHAAPTIANGKVYVSTFSNKIVAYGLLPVSGPVTVPRLIGQAEAAATEAVVSARLILGTVTTTPSATVPVGIVMGQSPAPAVLVALGSAVDLVVSSGPAMVAVPNVVDLTQTAATNAIAGAGLTVGTVTTASSMTVSLGSVISSEPVAGTSVVVGSAVNLVVSTGAPVLVPAVVGLTQTAATAAITDAALTVGTIFTAPSATVPTGSVISQNPSPGTAVIAGSAVNFVVSTGPIALGVDKMAFSDGRGARTISQFSTSGAGELLVAFAASDGPPGGGQTIELSGAGLTWTLVQRVNTRPGTSEIWRAMASNALTNVSITSTPTVENFDQSLTLIAFTGASGTGATTGANAASGAPTVSLTTTQPGSLVYGVGNDWDRAVARTVGAEQVMVHQYLAPAGDTMWTQSRSAAVASAGTLVQINDTAPTNDRWNLAAVEILAASSAVLVLVPNVANLTEAAARTAITTAGLIVGTATTASSATVPVGSVISQTPTTGTPVAPGSAVHLVVSTGLASGSPVVDTVVFSDGTGTRTTPAFSTSAPGDVLVAFAASDGPGTSPQTVTISGAGLTWTLVLRGNTNAGTSEIWQARANGQLTNVTVQSVASVAGYRQSLTVVAFSGASGVGASAAANGATVAPSVTLVTTRANSLLYGVGNDWDGAVARTLGANQAMVHQVVDTAIGDTFWVQTRNGTIAEAGTSVQLNDTAPTNNRWNFVSVEIVP
jgi:beta-lactam-binding protein with PASTA domain